MRHTSTSITILVLTLWVTAAACVDPDLEPGRVGLAAVDPQCDTSGCGTNSSVIAGVYFHELNLGSIPNDEGVKLVGYRAWMGGPRRVLDVLSNRLVARNVPGGPVVAQHTQLVGSVLEVEVEGVVYPVVVSGVHQNWLYWAQPAASSQLESYFFTYHDLGTNETEPLCTVQETGEEWLDLGLDAVVFEGDRYDKHTLDITSPVPVFGNSWFNIACAGSATLKEFLVRHAWAAGGAPPTTLGMRRAMLNAWTANYCGDGRSFTIPGVPLRVRDALGWIPRVPPISWSDGGPLGPYEAVWGPGGALCLEVPRRAAAVPGIYEQIRQQCDEVGHPLPTCSELGLPARWELSGHVLTALPAPGP